MFLKNNRFGCQIPSQVKCNDVIVNDGDVAKAVIDFVSESTIEKLVVGAPSSKGGFVW